MYVMYVCTDHAWHDPLLAVPPPQLRGGVAAEGEDVPGLGEAGRVLGPQRHRDDLLLDRLQLGRHQGLLHLACKWKIIVRGFFCKATSKENASCNDNDFVMTTSRTREHPAALLVEPELVCLVVAAGVQLALVREEHGAVRAALHVGDVDILGAELDLARLALQQPPQLTNHSSASARQLTNQSAPSPGPPRC